MSVDHEFVVAPTTPVPLLLGRDQMSHHSGTHMLIDPDATTPRLYLTKFKKWINGTPAPTWHHHNHHTFLALDEPTMAPPGVHIISLAASSHLDGAFTIDHCTPQPGLVLETQVTRHQGNGKVPVLVTNNTTEPIPIAATACLARVLCTRGQPTQSATDVMATNTTTMAADTNTSDTTSPPPRPRSVEELLKERYESAEEDGTDPFSDATVPEAALDAEFEKLLRHTTNHHELTRVQRRRTLKLLRTHRAAFSTTEQKVGKMTGPGVSFTMRNKRPIFIAPYPTSPFKGREILRQVKQLEKDDVIGPTKSPHDELEPCN
jgi:hypothetical protein